MAEMIASGELAAKKIRGQWRITRIEVDRVVREIAAGAEAERRERATAAELERLQGGAA